MEAKVGRRSLRGSSKEKRGEDGITHEGDRAEGATNRAAQVREKVNAVERGVRTGRRRKRGRQAMEASSSRQKIQPRGRRVGGDGHEEKRGGEARQEDERRKDAEARREDQNQSMEATIAKMNEDQPPESQEQGEGGVESEGEKEKGRSQQGVEGAKREEHGERGEEGGSSQEAKEGKGRARGSIHARAVPIIRAVRKA